MSIIFIFLKKAHKEIKAIKTNFGILYNNSFSKFEKKKLFNQATK